MSSKTSDYALNAGWADGWDFITGELPKRRTNAVRNRREYIEAELAGRDSAERSLLAIDGVHHDIFRN
jgi:hypothetical protein